jgi:hypothetical protein
MKQVVPFYKESVSLARMRANREFSLKKIAK